VGWGERGAVLGGAVGVRWVLKAPLMASAAWEGRSIGEGAFMVQRGSLGCVGAGGPQKPALPEHWSHPTPPQPTRPHLTCRIIITDHGTLAIINV
jgi:hypothetical protein